MENSLPPNVRYIEEVYAETWPTSTQYGSMQFGPIKEGLYVLLPFPLELSRRTVQEQWEFLQDQAKSFESHNMLLTWHIRLAAERMPLFLRVRAVVIDRVNDALGMGYIRNAVRRDPQTGRPA